MIWRRLAILTRKVKFANNQNGKRFTTDQKTADFGFTKVPESERQEKVNAVFDSVAGKYDLMNDVMSAGVHRIWKNMFVDQIHPIAKLKYLDVAGGTGDITMRILNYVSETGYSSELNPSMVTICDINPEMMSMGQQRLELQKFKDNIDWVEGNAEQLPFDENTFDVYTISFGIRNCTHIDKVLSEAYRVLKPNGRFYCLEFSRVQNHLLRSIFNRYSFEIIPVMGKLIAGDWHSYQYLVESIRKFPPQEEFASMMRIAGFQYVNWTNLSGGIAASHFGLKKL